ncbi:MAG: hypothetical protein KC433_20840, partial [Anaerolineales bacterium]|nr:hypothetical protein [Anaerolineales bacterium]
MLRFLSRASIQGCLKPVAKGFKWQLFRKSVKFSIFNLSCYFKNMAEAHGQNKQADFEFKTHTGHRMNALGQDALNQ